MATWEEMDAEGRVWTVPAARMKMNREHRVPLSGRAFEIYDAARTLGDDNLLVFPNRRGQPGQGHVVVGTAQETWISPAFPTASAPASGIGRPKRPTTRGRSSRRRWPMLSATGSRRPILARTCSSGAGSQLLMDDWAEYLAGGICLRGQSAV